MGEYGRIREGMQVYGADGEKLGKVVSVGLDGFVIEKGLLFTKDFIVKDHDVEQVLKEELWLRRRRGELAPAENVPGEPGTTGVPPPVIEASQAPLHAGASQALGAAGYHAAGPREGDTPSEGSPPEPGEVRHEPDRKLREERQDYEREANNAPSPTRGEPPP